MTAYVNMHVPPENVQPPLRSPDGLFSPLEMDREPAFYYPMIINYSAVTNGNEKHN